MTLRRAHGKGARALVRVETSPADELPAGVPAPASKLPPGNRSPDNRFAPGEQTKIVAAAGGRARAEQRRLARLLGLVELPEEHPLTPYRRDAADWRNAQLARLAQTVGGGECGPAVQAIVSSAALQHAASRWLFDRSAVELDHKLALDASRLADASRQAMLTAHELCAREAQARPRRDPVAALLSTPVPDDWAAHLEPGPKPEEPPK